MNNTLQKVLVDTLEYLILLNQERIRPDEARERLKLLQARYPEMGIDLLWDEEVYDNSIHYDILLHLIGEGTISLSFCPDLAIPWPMRGVHRWSERDLVRVNNTLLTMEQAITYLDFIWDEVPIIKQLIDICLIREVLDKDPIDLTDAELQLAMNSFRKRQKLYKAEDTYYWLEQHGMTHEKLQRFVENEAIVKKLRDKVTTERVADYFAVHQVDFNTANIAQIQFTDHESAHQVWKQIHSGEVDFYEAAQHRFLEMVERRDSLSGEVFTAIQRGKQKLELERAVFDSDAGQVLEPVRTDQGYAIVKVLSFKPAHLDDQTVTRIKKILFEEWLAERRHRAKIEWNWGNVSHTAQIA